MIELRKGATPAKLAHVDVQKRLVALKAEIDLHRFDYMSGARNIDLGGLDAYRHVKEEIARDQHDKCCYCESRFIKITSYGAVEHFRPKAAVKQDETTSYPSGYYWLICDWSNLYLSCEVCNTSHKATLFPLEDDSRRARHHDDALDDEEPVLVDPYCDDPDEHFVWRDEVIVPRTTRGEESIRIYGLDREELANERLEKIQVLKLSMKFLEELLQKRPVSSETVSFIDSMLDAFCAEKSEYAAMCREKIRTMLDPHL